MILKIGGLVLTIVLDLRLKDQAIVVK